MKNLTDRENFLYIYCKTETLKSLYDVLFSMIEKNVRLSKLL